MEILGLIPSGGTGSRLGKIPCSKEVFPVIEGGEITVLSSNLVRYYSIAGITQQFFIVHPGKWDIPGYYGDGSAHHAHIGYLIMNLPYGTPFTVDQAFPFVQDKMVALGFPDIMFEPEDAFVQLRIKLEEGSADIILGAVPCKEVLRSDMLEFDDKGRIKNIVIKQNRSDLQYGWFIAIWRPRFSHFMHQYLQDFLVTHPTGRYFDDMLHLEREIYMGDVVQAALKKGLEVDYHLFPHGQFTDLGTKSALYHHYLK